jgi:hypothetical protein
MGGPGSGRRPGSKNKEKELKTRPSSSRKTIINKNPEKWYIGNKLVKRKPAPKDWKMTKSDKKWIGE